MTHRKKKLKSFQIYYDCLLIQNKHSLRIFLQQENLGSVDIAISLLSIIRNHDLQTEVCFLKPRCVFQTKKDIEENVKQDIHCNHD